MKCTIINLSICSFTKIFATFIKQDVQYKSKYSLTFRALALRQRETAIFVSCLWRATMFFSQFSFVTNYFRKV